MAALDALALPQAQRDANRRGIRLMLAAMGCLVVNDSLVKYASQSLPVAQLIFVRGLFATGFVLLAARAGGLVPAPRRLASRWVLVRAGLDALGTLLYIVSLAHLPLGNATAIGMAAPLFITVLAVLWLKARVDAPRWLAVAAGFAGVLLVIQPRADGFNAFAWLCLLATLLQALRDLVTLRVPRDLPSLGVTLATALAVTLLAGLVQLGGAWQPIAPAQLALLAAAAAFLAAGYQLLVAATRAAEPAVVAPLRYSGLLMAVATGWLIWGDMPNALAWAGIALLFGAGLLLLRQDRG
ncbi:MAG: DMT family transporter [Rubrivivax sp.]